MHWDRDIDIVRIVEQTHKPSKITKMR